MDFGPSLNEDESCHFCKRWPSPETEDVGKWRLWTGTLSTPAFWVCPECYQEGKLDKVKRNIKKARQGGFQTMGLFTFLAGAFIIAKALGWLAWSWWWLPVIFLGDLILVILAIFGFATFASIVAYFRKKK